MVKIRGSLIQIAEPAKNCLDQNTLQSGFVTAPPPVNILLWEGLQSAFRVITSRQDKQKGLIYREVGQSKLTRSSLDPYLCQSHESWGTQIIQVLVHVGTAGLWVVQKLKERQNYLFPCYKTNSTH